MIFIFDASTNNPVIARGGKKTHKLILLERGKFVLAVVEKTETSRDFYLPFIEKSFYVKIFHNLT